MNRRRINFHGMMEYYYDTGQLRERVLYEKGRKVGPATYYYPNGQRQREIIHTRKREVPDTLIHYFDSLGTTLVVDGEGFVREVSRNGKNFEEGKDVGGLRVGEWSGTFRNGRYSFVEDYENGELIAGITTDSKGKTYPYKKRRIDAKYGNGSGNGLDILRREVISAYRFPVAAQNEGVEGYVVVRFVVDADGEMGDYTVLQDLGCGTGEAGVDALRSASEKWIPAVNRGIPARVTYTLPFRLKLQYGGR